MNEGLSLELLKTLKVEGLKVEKLRDLQILTRKSSEGLGKIKNNERNKMVNTLYTTRFWKNVTLDYVL